MKAGYTYTDEHLSQISFPLGGIGSGCIGLAGNGRLVDWEIFNRPNKGATNAFSHFAVRAERGQEVLDTRILNGDLAPPYTGQFNGHPFDSFGFGPPREYLSGLPHFKNNEFQGRFPIAELTYSDDSFPGQVRQRAFNPFIPGSDVDSSIPGAFFEISIRNTTESPLRYTIAFSVGSPFSESPTISQYTKSGDFALLTMAPREADPESATYGDLTLGTDASDVSYQEYWYRGNWYDNLAVYWKDLTRPGSFKNRSYQTATTAGWTNHADHALLAAHVSVEAGDEETVRFVLSWNFPVYSKYWKTQFAATPIRSEKPTWNNFYVSLFENSGASARYALQNWTRLSDTTTEFRDCLFASTLPEYVVESISANLSTLKSPTSIRLEDGTFYGWEGCHPRAGCCEGSCTHVWNYAYALPFLFPQLERSMRESILAHNLGDSGDMTFRLTLPLGEPRWNFRPCVDGQFGEVIKVYREWKISGDTGWLKRYWGSVVSALEFAWSPDNHDMWDPDRTGVIRGRQHHTLDMELFGPNSWLTGFYLAALKAAAELAAAVGDPGREVTYSEIFTSGYEWVKENLFNGDYFVQQLDLEDRTIVERFSEGASLVGDTVGAYWDEEHGQIKYQLAEGCHIDQVLAQWHATLNGLGDIYDPDQYQSALRTTFKRNYKDEMRSFPNPCRVFSLNDESGVVICDYGDTGPAVGIPYAEETMNGYEYAFAAQLVSIGMVDEGNRVVEAIRERYDGSRRNPWNEFECGSNYARSMASYSLLLVFSGFEYDIAKKSIFFTPVHQFDTGRIFRSFWAINDAWGSVSFSRESFELSVRYGSLELQTLGTRLPSAGFAIPASVGGEHIEAIVQDENITFPEPVVLTKGVSLNIRVEPRERMESPHDRGIAGPSKEQTL